MIEMTKDHMRRVVNALRRVPREPIGLCVNWYVFNVVYLIDADLEYTAENNPSDFFRSLYSNYKQAR